MKEAVSVLILKQVIHFAVLGCRLLKLKLCFESSQVLHKAQQEKIKAYALVRIRVDMTICKNSQSALALFKCMQLQNCKYGGTNEFPSHCILCHTYYYRLTTLGY